MSRIENTFKQSKVFAAYITAGDGSLAQQMDYVRSLLQGGVNLLEIGVPFSDPIADGIVIQRAMQRALDAHTTLEDVLKLVQAIRSESDIAMILFTYYNPLFNAKQQDILAQFKAAGIDGILVIDLPFFEATDHLQTCKRLTLDPIAVIAPTTSVNRLKELSAQGSGFLYYACQKGTTGVRQQLPADLKDNIAKIKQATTLPVIVGFGIASRETSQAAIALADGFVVGSYFIEAMESGMKPNLFKDLVKSINPFN